MAAKSKMVKFPNYKILSFVPNIIGYARLLLQIAAWLNIDTVPHIFILFYSASVILDVFDGIIARKLNQTSAFGAWFDVVIDNLGRGMLWSFIYKWGYFVSALEWLVFVCTHTYGPNWKMAGTNKLPFWVEAVMANTGLHILPIWLYALQNLQSIHEYFNSQTVACITLVLVLGRLTCLFVEAWFVLTHVKTLLTNSDEH